MSAVEEATGRILILGDGGTGKSCITLQLVRNRWIDEYDPTIEDRYVTTRVVDGINYNLNIIDTAGQEEYRDMLSPLFNGDSFIDGYLMVYDITSPTSLEALEYFNDLIDKTMEVQYQSNKPSPIKLVAGNKCDLVSERLISSQQGLTWARNHGCGFIETSAKQMVNIEEALQLMIRKIAQERKFPNGENNNKPINVNSSNRTKAASANGDYPQSQVPGPARQPEYSSTNNSKGGCCVLM
ncbi:ras-domain-containing protein [Nadsonia fulvescens var. elongata DSM 6958]|uniref:Ras-domain-containing protein n=1 Tax=Nadsonia fulvescens var. elongata DSM 6958 TaxID=857566 RepID=A0A1E3PNQ4_9ASCO|nr:ras-domain-containing protein [Nadsonia fulvescens var. elongata DSM 6958]